MTPIAIADLGAGLDAALSAVGVVGNWMLSGPRVLEAVGRVQGGTADLRFYRRDARLGRWVPLAPLATVDSGVDAGVFALRITSAEIEGEYALVKMAGAGTVTYHFSAGRS